MRKINLVMIVMQVLLWTGASGAQVHHVPLKADDHGVDLPTLGSSLFDKIFPDSIPFPLDHLLKRSHFGASDYVHTLFPFSRSLQRPVDLRYDPLLNPRLVIAPTQGFAANKLFMGYVKATDQIEVISFNDEAGRFEYQIVKDFTRSPKVFYVNRGKCLSCHQGQSPIFSRGPWSDSSLGLYGELISAKLGLSAGNNLNEAQIFERLFSSRRSQPNVTLLDSMVRTSNALALDERIWIHGCDDNRECRLGILLKTIAPGAQVTESYFSIAVRQIENSALRQDFFYHSVLSNTDLGLREVIQKNTDNGRWDLNRVAHSDSALMELIANIYRMGEKDNPASPRPRDMKSLTLFNFKLSNFTDEDFLALNEGGRSHDQIALAALDFFKDPSSFGARPIHKALLMKQILTILGSSQADSYLRWLDIKAPEKKLLVEPIAPAFQTLELNVFSRHCASCHASGAAYPPQFLLGREDQVLLQINGMKHRLLAKLQNQLMPPDPEKRKTLNESGDGAILINYLRSL